MDQVGRLGPRKHGRTLSPVFQFRCQYYFMITSKLLTMIILIRKYIVATLVLAMMTACNEDFLKPEPLSFFSPENALVDKQGMESLLTTCDHLMRLEYTVPKIRIEVMMTDIGACSGCSLGDFAQNLYP